MTATGLVTSSSPSKSSGSSVSGYTGTPFYSARAPEPPKVILTQSVDDYLTELCYQCTGEVGGLGYLTINDDGDFIVDEVFLLPQIVSSGSVDFTKDAMVIAIEKAMNDGRYEDMRFSFHSHGNMKTFWSGTDERGIQTYLEGGMPYLVSMVTNRRGDALCRVDIAEVPPLAGGICIPTDPDKDGLDVEVIRLDRTTGRARQDIEANVAERKNTWKNSKGKKLGKGKPTGNSTGPARQLTTPLTDDEREEVGDRIKAAIEKVKAENNPNVKGDRPVESDEDENVIDSDAIEIIPTGDNPEVTPREIELLQEHGYDPEDMDEEQMTTALITIELQGQDYDG